MRQCVRWYVQVEATWLDWKVLTQNQVSIIIYCSTNHKYQLKDTLVVFYKGRMHGIGPSKISFFVGYLAGMCGR
jgi:hypothetical protein